MTETDGEPQLRSFETIPKLHQYVLKHELPCSDYAIIKGELMKSFAMNLDLGRLARKEQQRAQDWDLFHRNWEPTLPTAHPGE